MTDEQARELIGQRRFWLRADLKCVKVTVSMQRDYGEAGGVEESVQGVDLIAKDGTGWMGMFTLAEWIALPLAPKQEDVTT